MVSTLVSAVRVFIVPRGISDRLTALVFRIVRRLFDLAVWRLRSYRQRDRLMAFFAPAGLLTLIFVWLALVLAGYTAMFWAAGVRPVQIAFMTSGSSLLTLGFEAPDGIGETLLTFSEALIGLTLAALLISYLPTMYAAFSRRETAVTMLETQAGTPPSPKVLLVRLYIIGELDRMSQFWMQWQLWFADVSESHTSLSPLIFYRSPRSDRSWITAAGAVLDTASIVASTLDRPRDPEAELCVRAGYLALRQIADFFSITYEPDARYPRNPISVTREEFDALCDELEAVGIALKPDRDQAWQDFAGWRVNYDTVLLALAGLLMAPPAPWSSDRARQWRLPLWSTKKVYHEDRVLKSTHLSHK